MTTTDRPLAPHPQPVSGAWHIRALQQQDIAALTPVLRQHIRDLHSGDVVEQEVQAVMDYMRGGSDAAGRQRRYLVACAATGNTPPLACMAWAVPDAVMREHFAAQQGLEAMVPDAGVELLNAFVAADVLGGKGVGRALFSAVCAAAADDGAHWLIVNSGPRYRHSWGFYDRVCDSSHGLIDNYYGPGRHAKTWLKTLNRAG